MKKYIPLIYFLISLISNVTSQTAEILFVEENNFQYITVCESDSDYILAGSQGIQNGDSGSYLNSQDVTLTLCPALLGDVINLEFSTCFLNQEGNLVDQISIWDGNNLLAPLIGNYTNNSLEGLIISASSSNFSGCLTLKLITNETGLGNIIASISCTTPCVRPTAVASYDAPLEGKICIGDSINFDGSNSFASEGLEVDRFIWNFNDGFIDTVSGAVTSHIFSSGGVYLVQLYILDNSDSGCASTNFVNLPLLVAPAPDWSSFPSAANLCLGESLELNVNPNDFEITWSGFPSLTFDYPVYVPDCFGAPITFTLNFTGFSYGQTLLDLNDLQEICIDFEHTFLGDLSFKMICPNGNSTFLHQQGTGADLDYWPSSFLGQACDIDNNCGDCFSLECVIPGLPYHYCWSPNATLGSWSQESNLNPNYTESYIGLDGYTYTDIPILEPNTYNIPNPNDWNNLLGCPLNGDWVLEIIDYWGADNGSLGMYAINFNPDIMPETTVFTVEIGNSADSSYWTGNEIIYTSSDYDSIVVQPSLSGDYQYTYAIINNHGCQYDSTVTITVIEAQPSSSVLDTVVCFGNFINVASNLYYTSGTYTDILTNAVGCDSIITTNLTVNDPINTNVNTNGFNLAAVQSGASYQWINCDNSNLPIVGETSQNFIADASGNYSVIVSVGDCSDTSACIYVNIIGINENTNTDRIKIYPNPSKGIFNIDLKTSAQITVTNLLGKEILNKNYLRGMQIINLQAQSNGLYFVKINSTNSQQIVKLIKAE